MEYIVFPDYQGHGYTKEALKGLTDFTFSGKALIEEQTPYVGVRKVVPSLPKCLPSRYGLKTRLREAYWKDADSN